MVESVHRRSSPPKAGLKARSKSRPGAAKGIGSQAGSPAPGSARKPSAPAERAPEALHAKAHGARPGPRASPSSAAEPAAPRGCTNLKLRQLTRQVTQHYDAIVGATGLRNTQYSLLSHVLLLGPLRPSELAAHMRLDSSTLTRNLQPLVAQGWVEVQPGPDGRSRLVVITDAGRAQRAAGQRAWKQAQLALNARLGADRVARLHALIDECLERLDADLTETDDDAHT